ncbi:NADP-dependent oxidoreductase domain-containing protein 1 [Castor canadensis]|uniref:NADP-dependent oxidoreductase domain-containing protein 1 n=1 Tax=Castor canadensis TaxID=51338 RepID=A0AC58M2D5_CASCN
MDILKGLESLQFAYGLPEEERFWLYLQSRSRGLMIEACAHAVFFCKLFHNLREILHENQRSHSLPAGSPDLASDSEKLKVGIIGGGHLGKQLVYSLLQLVPVPANNLRISTRRPEALEEFQKMGILCFYNNSCLANWANVVFLCCLPSQLPRICLEIQTRLEKTCIVYSLVAAIPLPRLKLLLNHTNILRPQYHCVEDFDHIWGTNKEIRAALQDPVILQATCPYSHTGGVILNIKWLEGLFYAALNICTANNMFYSKALQVLNKLFLTEQDHEKDKTPCPKFQLKHFVNKMYVKNLLHKRPFPWFDLTAVQLKETPFSQYLSANTVLQDHLTCLYCDSFGISPTKEQTVVPRGSPSQQGTSASGFCFPSKISFAV